MHRKLSLFGIIIFSSIITSDSIPSAERELVCPVFDFANSNRLNKKFTVPITKFWETGRKTNPVIDTASLKQSNWYAQAIRYIEESEYEIKYDEATQRYASPNRKNGLRSFYTGKTFTLLPRNDSNDNWKLELTTLGVYAGNKLIYAPVNNTVVSLSPKTIQFSNENDFTTEYVNNKEGIRQNFIIKKEPTGKPRSINLKLRTNKGWLINRVHDKEIHFAKVTKRGDNKKITYNSLKVWDADKNELEASFSVKNNCIDIEVNTSNAVYPITIDPLSTGTAGTPDWIGDDADQAEARFAWCVSSAGDVNGDGYSDVIIGDPFYDIGANIDEGRAFIYYGSSTGLSSIPNDIIDGVDPAGVRFALSVATAGDVNGDGFSDIIIGAYAYTDGPNVGEGQAFVYYGSATGLPSSPNWVGDDADQVGAGFGISVACAGDVNADGYSDVIIGAYLYNDGANTDEGRAFVYHGSATGLSTIPNSTPDDANLGGAYFGSCVASAGDVNGDGYGDVIIGAYKYDDDAPYNIEGRAYVYHGSAAGLLASPNWVRDDADQNQSDFGFSLASAGDTNGDGYSDVIIGAYEYDEGANGSEGRAFVYYGSATGLSSFPNWIGDDANQPVAHFGYSVASAGDVNGDGYSDVIIGAYLYNDGANNDEGRAFVYYGSATGLSLDPISTPDDGDQDVIRFGYSVASAGDVNGDGFSDVVIGAPFYDEGASANEGRAFVYHGGPTGLSSSPNNTPDDANQANASFGYSVASAGDVNGDGYSDVIIGAYEYDDGVNTDEGRAFLYHGGATGLSATPNSTPDDANQASAYFGRSVACAGDVNGDGYSDVIIGASGYDDGINTNEGWAFVYYGSVTGLSASPNNTLDDSDQANANFGWSVAGAGDVNGDGYGDVIIGAWRYADGVNNQEGRAFIYHGSAAGLSAIPNSTPDDANQAFAYFGYSVAGAGDLNGDGYSDVIIGAYGFNDGTNTQEGRAFVYHGSSSGLSANPNNTPDDANLPLAFFGWSVAGAGDVNGDGYSDVIIGALTYDDGINDDEGRAFVYHGSATGLSATPNSTPDDADQDLANFGSSVASAGDVNGDGYSDVVIGAFLYDDGANADEGRAYVYYGSSTGLSANPDNTLDDSDQANSDFGFSVACAGDVNGDGYSDVIIGAYSYDDGANTNEGRCLVYYGNNGGGLRNNLRLYNQDLTTPIQQINVTQPNLFGAGLFAKSPLGRVKGKLVWEVKSQGIPFSGNPITNSAAYLDKQTSFTNLGIAGVELKSNVQKVGSRNNKIRTRVEYDKVTAITGQVYGPWRYPAGYTMGAYGMNSVPLPITLISLNGQFINADDVQLNWITTNEINMRAFIVERSTDGINFTEAGELTAKGIGSSRADYLFLDKNVQHELLYYRLKLKEINGALSYTKTITLRRSKIVRSFIAPNPVMAGADALLNIHSSAKNCSVAIRIYNLQGQLVLTVNKILQRGLNQVRLSTKGMVKGIYLVNVLGEGVKESYKLGIN